jgi:hypothetical protein
LDLGIWKLDFGDLNLDLGTWKCLQKPAGSFASLHYRPSAIRAAEMYAMCHWMSPFWRQSKISACRLQSQTCFSLNPFTFTEKDKNKFSLWPHPEGKLQSFWSSALETCNNTDSRPGCFTQTKRLNRRLGGPKCLSGIFCAGCSKFLCSNVRSSHYTNWATPNHCVVS